MRAILIHLSQSPYKIMKTQLSLKPNKLRPVREVKDLVGVVMWVRLWVGEVK